VPKITLHDYLKNVRNERGLTLRHAAELCKGGISHTHIYQLENQVTASPSPHILYAIATGYKISYCTLMELAGYVIPKKGK
jgi:transcriptional regulator with XRE-family HTH domain